MQQTTTTHHHPEGTMFLCQVRLEAEWLTVTSGTRRGADAWVAQVAPRMRRNGYSTRVVAA